MLHLQVPQITLTVAAESFIHQCNIIQHAVIGSEYGKVCYEETVTIQLPGYVCVAISTICLLVGRYTITSLLQSSQAEERKQRLQAMRGENFDLAGPT